MKYGRKFTCWGKKNPRGKGRFSAGPKEGKTRDVFVRNTMPPIAPLWKKKIVFFYLWPWRMTLTLHHSKCAALWKRRFELLFFWPLTLKDDLDLELPPLNMCSFMRYTYMPNIKLRSSIVKKLWPMVVFGRMDRCHILDLWPWRMTLTLSFHHSKYAVCVCQKHCPLLRRFDFFFTFDLEGWPWPYNMYI